MRIVIVVLFLSGLLIGCQTPAPVVDCSSPSLSDVAQKMASCLSASASELEVETLLSQWAHEGDALVADLLPNSPSPELILTYRLNLEPYNPQGKLAVLEYTDDRWQVAFESPDPQQGTIEGIRENGRNALTGNWWFDLDQVGDIQADSSQDILFHQRWSNLTSTFLSYAKLLTVIDGTIHVLLVEDDFSSHRPTYTIDGSYIHSHSHLGQGMAMTRTLALDGDTFVQSTETINPAAAELSLTLADGSQFISFDNPNASPPAPSYGLYRIHQGQQFHYHTPTHIRTLVQLRDGHIYIGGANILRVVDDELHTIDNDFAPLPSPPIWQVMDIAMTSQGEIWAAGQLNLVHFGHHQSTIYQLPTTKVTIAPDDSVWALGWDGQANSNCCIFHIEKGLVTTYQRDDILPVSAELNAKIRG